MSFTSTIQNTIHRLKIYEMKKDKFILLFSSAGSILWKLIDCDKDRESIHLENRLRNKDVKTVLEINM